MLLGMLGIQMRGRRTKGPRSARKPRLELLENRRLMYGANALSWDSTASNTLWVDTAAVSNVGDSLNANGVPIGEQACLKAANSASTAVEVRFLRRQYLAADRNTVMGETLCVPAQEIENADAQWESVPLLTSQSGELTPADDAAAEPRAHVLALSDVAIAESSPPAAETVGEVQTQTQNPNQDQNLASVRSVVSGSELNESHAAGAATVPPGGNVLTSIASQSQNTQNTQSAPSQVVIITLKRRVPASPPGAGGTSGTGNNSNGTATDSGNSTTGNSTTGNSTVTLPLNNQGGSSGDTGGNGGANAGTNPPLAQIPNVLSLPSNADPVSAGSGTTSSGNSTQPADPPSPPTVSTIGLGRLLLNAGSSGQAESNSTGASGAGHTTGSASTTSAAATRSLLTSAGNAAAGGTASASSSSTSWPELVDIVLADPPADATSGCLRSEFCLLRL